MQRLGDAVGMVVSDSKVLEYWYTHFYLELEHIREELAQCSEWLDNKHPPHGKSSGR